MNPAITRPHRGRVRRSRAPEWTVPHSGASEAGRPIAGDIVSSAYHPPEEGITMTITHPLNDRECWLPNPELVAVLTGESHVASLDDAIAAATERLKGSTLRQKSAASLRAALKVAGVARVDLNAHNRTWRDSAGGKRIQARVFAQAGA